nr:hypothetical protein [Tanacetum cinerariifolium]
MFGRPDGQDQVWKSQRSVHGQAKVKTWKLLESCGVDIISFITTQLILLVERRYPLSRFTLDQMLNAVRLQVEERSEMSLELLRKPFTKSPNMYKEYLAEFWYSAKALENFNVFFLIPTGGVFGEVGVNTFRNAIGEHYLPHSSEYIAPPSIDVVRQWFPMIGYEEKVSTKETLRKSLFPPKWRLLMAQII